MGSPDSAVLRDEAGNCGTCRGPVPHRLGVSGQAALTPWSKASRVIVDFPLRSLWCEWHRGLVIRGLERLSRAVHMQPPRSL